MCIYHGNCADGFSAAWTVHRALGGNVEFVAGVHQQPPPDVTDKRVVIVDFSYKRPVLLEMAKQAKEIVIIDHHKTAQADLVDLPDNVKTIFDMEHSGAMLTWHYFFPGETPPKLIEHVQDRDLWKFKLPFTREIQAAVFSHEYTFENWNWLMLKASIDELIAEGKVIERKHFKDMHELLKVTARWMNIGGYDVRAANLPYTFSSDAAHELAIGGSFGACYWDTPTGRVFSLRSTETGIDVSDVAKEFGGGGHKHAAGFSIPFSRASEFEL